MAHPVVRSESEIEAMFGAFTWKPNAGRNITILNDWVEANITTVYIPELDGVPTYGGKFKGNVRWHRKGIEQLQRAFADIGKADLQKCITLWGGSFYPRLMTHRSVPSRHSWGIALDLNTAENPYGHPPAAEGKKGCLLPLAPIFEKHGFCWGGRWKPSNCDGMHFEIAETRSYRVEKPAPNVQLVINDVWQQAIPVTLKDGVAYASVVALECATGGDPAGAQDRLVPVANHLRNKGYVVKWNAAQKKLYAYTPS